MKTRTLVPAVFVSLMLALAGCSSSSADSESAPSAVVEQSSGDMVDIEGGTVGASEFAAVADREVITTGSMTVTAEDPIAAASEAIKITEAAGGRVDARTEYAPVDGNKGGATVTLRLPSKDLTASLDKLGELGEVEQLSLSSVDVTTQAQDLDARITATRASVDRLLTLLVGASDTDTLVKLETAIAERQGNLESMEAQRRSISDQVSLSTLQLELISEADAPVDDPDTFWSGLVAGWGAFVAFFAALLVALGVLAPWIVLIGIVLAVVLFIVRRRRRAAAAPSTAPPVEEPAAGDNPQNP